MVARSEPQMQLEVILTMTSLGCLISGSGTFSTATSVSYTGDGGEAGLGVDGDGEADRLEHGEVAGRVGVGDGLAQVVAVLVGQVDEGLVAGLAGGRDGGELPVVGTVGGAEARAHDVVEERPEGLDDEVEGAGDEHGAVAERTVLPDAADGCREGLGEEQLADVLEGILGDLVDRGAVVAAVEVAQEVAAVLAVEGQQAGRLGDRLEHEPEAVAAVQPPAGQPRVGRHHVGGDKRVLEVEGGEVPVGGEDLATQSLGAALAAPGGWPHKRPAGLDDRRQVDLGGVAVPVDDPGVEGEGGPVGLVEGVPEGEEAVQAVDGLTLGIGAVEVDVAHGPVDEVALLLEPGGGLGVAAPHG